MLFRWAWGRARGLHSPPKVCLWSESKDYVNSQDFKKIFVMCTIDAGKNDKLRKDRIMLV